MYVLLYGELRAMIPYTYEGRDEGSFKGSGIIP